MISESVYCLQLLIEYKIIMCEIEDDAQDFSL